MAINAGPRGRSAAIPVWGDGAGTPVRLTLTPGGDDLPPLFGHLIRSLPGYFGVHRHLLQLSEPLPSGFDPFGELPWFARASRIEHLLLTPASHLPTLDTPSNFISLAMARDEVVHVFISIGPHPARLRTRTTPRLPEFKYPFLAMGDLSPASRGVRL